MTTILLVWLGLSLFCAVHLVPFFVDAEHRRTEGKPLLAPTWSVWHLLYAGEAVFVLLLLLTGVYAIPLTLFAKSFGTTAHGFVKLMTESDFANPQALVLFFLPAMVLQNVAFFAVPAVTISSFYSVRLKSIGLPALPPRRAVVAGLLLGVIFLVASGVLGSGLEWLARQFDSVPFVKGMLRYEQTNPVAQMTTTLRKAGLAGLFWGLLAIGIAAPIGEEMLFRGFAQNVLSRRFGARWGIVLSALLFAAPHTYSLLGLTIIFAMGLSLAYVYRVGGSLWTCILIHAVNNSVQILLAYFGR